MAVGLNPVNGTMRLTVVLWLFIYFNLFYLGFLKSLSIHYIGHIMMGSFMGRGNQYIQLVKLLYYKLPTNGKQLPRFPLEVGPGIELRSQWWEVRVLSLCHCGPAVGLYG